MVVIKSFCSDSVLVTVRHLPLAPTAPTPPRPQSIQIRPSDVNKWTNNKHLVSQHVSICSLLPLLFYFSIYTELEHVFRWGGIITRQDLACHFTCLFWWPKIIWHLIKQNTERCSNTRFSLVSVVFRGIPGKKCGTIIVKAEELNNCRVNNNSHTWTVFLLLLFQHFSFKSINWFFSLWFNQESVMMQFCGNKLDKKDFFGKSDPFLVFYRSNEDGTWVSPPPTPPPPFLV